MRRTALIAIVLLVLSACRGYPPIPSDYLAAPPPPFQGEVWAGPPLPPQAIEAHPWLAAQGVNGMHDDSWGTNTLPWSGPIGLDPRVRSIAPALAGGEIATICFDRAGRLIAISGQFDRFELLLLDPEDLRPLCSYALPQRPSMKAFFRDFDYDTIMKDTSGGGYFHLGAGDKPIIADASRHIRVFRVDESGPAPRWVQESDWDLNPYLEEGDALTDACPDWGGLMWFISRRGKVGFVDPSDGRVGVVRLEGEQIQNSFSIASDGVYIVSDHALYRFEADAASGRPVFTWREAYDRGSGVKPGHIDQGSGTTPTLFGADLVAITDNNDRFDRLLVYHRGRAWEGERLVCVVPLFDEGPSSSENSITAWGMALFIENNYSYTRCGPMVADPRSHPGIVRVDVDVGAKEGRVAWVSGEASPTVVPKLSGNGLLYVYTRDLAGDPSVIPGSGRPAAWFLTAIDAMSGRTVFKVHTGNGPGFNNNYAPITIAPDGTAYIGCFRGLISVKDAGRAPDGPGGS